ncbi:GPI-GlcNAc transferase complex, PIG-H component-domain-containing protein [Lophiotrema nucula]|uniref:GPI-GlcNAc transferase complex, PIG-H component-domain-containing protein n=1 Tax=Lophiotrema nucula TaxID=690887 RepID=A0A6A5YUL7_9PLEO|nr:GPI-GlcNAc transferase complex, PIG-H component-domain-containing protein [Lophiotrema nucula]
MAPPKQSLTVLQPTPSTVSFTVSTRPVPKTLPALFSFYLSVLVKILLGTLALTALWTKWRVNTAKSTWPLEIILGDTFEEWVQKAVESIQWMYLAPAALAILYKVIQRGYIESLLALSSLGLQTRTSSPTYLSTSTTRFIPTTAIQDIFIYEAFKGFEVRFYLAIVVKGEEDVVVVFPKLLPRRDVLEEVWRGARACLYGGEGGSGIRRKHEREKQEI